ncbi:hypothetical protein GQ457_03G001630 [Hibiscus cannabinus]
MRFFWKGHDILASGARVSWKDIYKLKSECGPAVKDLCAWNRACLVYFANDLVSVDGSLWIVWVKTYAFKDMNLWTVESKSQFSCIRTHTRWDKMSILIQDEDLLKTLEENLWSLLKEVFVDVEFWSDSFKIPERTTWIEVAGIPLHCWNSITFNGIAAAWGSLEALGENANQALGCEKALICIELGKKTDY